MKNVKFGTDIKQSVLAKLRFRFSVLQRIEDRFQEPRNRTPLEIVTNCCQKFNMFLCSGYAMLLWFEVNLTKLSISQKDLVQIFPNLVQTLPEVPSCT